MTASKSINLVVPVPVWNGLVDYQRTGPLGYETVVPADGVEISIGTLIKYLITAYGELPKGQPSDLQITDVCDIIEELELGNKQVSVRTNNHKLLDATTHERTVYLISAMVNCSIPIPDVFDGYYPIDND